MENSNYPVTVQQAIRRAGTVVNMPSKAILVATVVVFVLLLVKSPSFWDLVVLPMGMVISTVYWLYAVPRWRIWAYENVADIDQLQRSAELAGLLIQDSYDKTRGLFLSKRGRDALAEQIKRFSGDAVFIDDPAIPGETAIESSSFWDAGKGPLITLSEQGIEAYGVGFFEWGKVENERLIMETYTSDEEDSEAYFFKFDSEGETYDTRMDTLKIERWWMDLLMYTYRGRFAERVEKNVNSAPVP